MRGDTAFHLAVDQQDYELVEWLCFQPGINLELPNFNSISSLKLARKNKDKKMIQILKKFISSNNAIHT